MSATDELQDRALREQEVRDALLAHCPKPGHPCAWEREDQDGLLVCRTCGEVLDE